jgi:ubiquinone/menaquinone biosynthesis C-methylase UbiE
MKQHNKTYWNHYYNSKENNNKPSNFAKFIKDKYVKKKTILLDVGAGDGRDSFYFQNKARYIFAVDQSDIVIKKNKLKVKRLNLKNLLFQKLSSNKLKILKDKEINLIYARFFLHAINETNENKFLNIIKKIFKANTTIALEFRTTKDVLRRKGKKISKNERLTDHYRRFIDTDKFKKKLEKMKFKILYIKQGINLSKSPNDNPHLCRIVFSRSY